MLSFIRRRIFQSLLILPGIMVLTFVLFRLTTGDPTAVLLGKNPVPSELENLRAQLGVDKPFFFGRECLTERYLSFDFMQGKTWPGSFTDSGGRYDSTGYAIGAGGLHVFPRFDAPHVKYRMSITTPAETRCYDFQASDSVWIFPNSSWGLSPGDSILQIAFSKLQKNPLNTQLFDTFKELVWVTPEFPYISFFNYGDSLSQQEPVKAILKRGIAPSLLLMIPIFLGELFLGVVLALIAVRFKDRFWDRVIMVSSVFGMSISYLAFILFGQYFLAYRLGAFPVWGFESLAYLSLPIIIGIISGLGGGIRFYRTVFVNELNKEYLRTAKAKGCSPAQIYFNHLLPNAMIPIMSRMSVTLPFLFTGSLLLEKFFGIPGLGFTGINALANADLQLIKAIVLFSALLFVVVNLLTDLLYAVVDPRIRVSGTR